MTTSRGWQTNDAVKIAAIDIGSNAVRLLFISVLETAGGPSFVKESMIRIPLRLGEEVFLNGKLPKDKLKKLVLTMQAFQKLIKVQEVDLYKACATSAMRDASNARKAIKMVYEKTGIEIEVISGQREAELIFSNHAEKFSTDPDKNYLYIDVGGGSTELILIHKGVLVDKWSFNIGTLRLKHNKIKESHWLEMEQWLGHHKKRYAPLYGIGSGGNINSVSKYFGKANSKEITREVILKTYNSLCKITPEEISIRYGLRTDRADVMVPALEIFKRIMEATDMPSVFVPKLGLPDGIIHELYESSRK
jgi:exopolyphosphatase / guanosine-5'-triphosphate,3'-diphosphate pyrophosphatase